MILMYRKRSSPIHYHLNSPVNWRTVYYYYFFLLERSSKTLRYGRYRRLQEDDVTPRASLLGTDGKFLGTGFSFTKLLETDTLEPHISGDDYALLAENITDIDLSRTNEGLITLTLRMEYDEDTYTKTLMFSARNIKKAASE